jgi:hypothetical protein
MRERERGERPGKASSGRIFLKPLSGRNGNETEERKKQNKEQNKWDIFNFCRSYFCTV